MIKVLDFFIETLELFTGIVIVLCTVAGLVVTLPVTIIVMILEGAKRHGKG